MLRGFPAVIPSEEARRRLPELLRTVNARPRGTRFVLGRHRRPEAVLLSVEDLLRLEDAARPDAARDPVRLLEEHRDEILRIAERYGATNVRVFGSVARGDAGPESDIDILVRLEPGRSLFDLGGIYSELEELLGPVDVVTEDGLKPRIRERVLREAVAV